MAQRVVLGPGYYPDPTIGRPVANGDIYVGVVDLDPEVEANQQQISVLQENGDTTEVAQPIHTGAGGVPIYNGSPVTILVDDDYSVKVLDSTGAQAYYVPSASAIADGIVTTDKLADGAVTLPKMAPGTPGNLISYDAAGDPEAVATGMAGHILTSNGVGLPPSFKVAPDTQRSIFEFKDIDEIYLGSAVYLHNGSSSQFVYWDSQLTYQFSALAVSDWSYLYLDNSAIVASATNVITATELVDSITEPVWSESKRGWYNGNDKCIFAVLTNSGSDILEFFHAGGFVHYATQITDLDTVDIDTSWVDVSLTIPKFSNLATAVVEFDWATDANILYYRTNGGGGLTLVAKVDTTYARAVNTMNFVTDSSQIIELSSNSTDAGWASVYTDGWNFPIGM